MLIDSMALADCTFLASRYASPETDVLLPILQRVLDEVKQRGQFLVEVPDEEFRVLSSKWQDQIRRCTKSDEATPAILPESSGELLSFCILSVAELKRLWADGSHEAVCSLSYAVHNFPSFVRADEPFNPDSFGFSFRVAAFHWSCLSVEMRAALANLAGIDSDEADRLAETEGFAIQMYRSPSKG